MGEKQFRWLYTNMLVAKDYTKKKRKHMERKQEKENWLESEHIISVIAISYGILTTKFAF